MIARDVPYATYLNKAADTYAVSPALLQAMIDDASPRMPELPELARKYAIDYARSLGIETENLEDGVQHPESNIMAMAQWLAYVFGRLQNQWQAIEEFYGGGPKGRMAMLHIASGPYERRRRQWS